MTTNKNFELFGGCLGNGITLANMAEIENGDYKTIGHISPGGKITWYVDENYIKSIPTTDYLKILDWSTGAKKSFRQKWFRKPELDRYFEILDLLYLKLISNKTWKQYLDDLDFDDSPKFSLKFTKLEEYYLENYA